MKIEPFMAMRPTVLAGLVTALLVATSCRSRRATPLDIPVGGTYYTQFALQYERDRFRTSNYRMGDLLPINSQVELVSANAREAVLNVPALGHEIVVEYVHRHSRSSMEDELDRLLGTEPVDLRVFNEAELAAIDTGSVEEGMSQAAVIAAIGYPPASLTPDLARTSWKYPKARVKNFVVAFDNEGVVRQVQW